MALVFLNGGSPNYTGFEFSTPTTLIDQLDTTLTAAGWTTITKVAATSLFTRGVSIVGGHNCWIEFIVSGIAPNLTLTIRGWLEAAKTNGSPNAIHTYTFTSGSTNRMWLTCDEEAGSLAIYNPTGGAMRGHHFGFVNRVDTGDQWAWMVGRIYASGYGFAYVARAQFDAAIWRQVGAAYNTGTVDPAVGNGSQAVVPITGWDYMMQGFFGAGVIDTNATANAFYNGHLGSLNYNSQAIVVPYYGYLEGKATAVEYGLGGGFPLKHFRGFVKHAGTGMASQGGAQQAVDPVTGFRYLSVGGPQWQAMRIL